MTRQRRARLPVIAAMLIAAGGTAGFVFAAHLNARNDTARARTAFDQSSASIAETLDLDLQHEADLELAANAFIVDHKAVGAAAFEEWGQAIQVTRRYPELTGVAWVALVPAAKLSSFKELGGPSPGSSAAVIPAGPRAYYCLPRLTLSKQAKVIPVPALDFCAGTQLFASRDSGHLEVVADTVEGKSVIGLASPIYRGGTVPATVGARRRDFLGWTAVAVAPDVLLAVALQDHPDTALVLRRATSTGTLVFKGGKAPRAAQSATLAVTAGATIQVFGPAGDRGIFADSRALVLLIGGTVLSTLIALLVLELGTGRSRAIRLVEAKTRELADEARVSAEARDDAVEASNAKSVFVATVSHELRTPLSGVIGTAELMMEHELDPVLSEYVEIIRSSSEGLLLVINDILDYSKIEAGKLELDPTGFALSELVAESCALLLPSARRKGIALDVEADPKLPGWLHGDAGRLRQVLINLLSNAVKFTSAGRVTVRVSATASTANAYLVHIEVADTGIGISEETLGRLFQPFTQADNTTARRYGGTGLGLTISAQLIGMMGGTVGAKSTPGEGSTFWFEVELPLADLGEPASHALDKFRAIGERDGAGALTDAAPLVLVAEDNPVNQMLAGRLLDKCGYRSEVVSDGREAVAATERTTYAAVVMDCQMPEMDGYEATRAIRSREGTSSTHIPIIATTAHSMSGDREKCLEAGMDDYLSKPIRARELRDLLTRYVVLPQALGTPAGP
jgi:signal transduction histidine kinase/ActR/RegA family two-component response regulator